MRITQPKKTPIQTIAKNLHCRIDRLGRHAVRLIPIGDTVYIKGPFPSGLHAFKKFIRDLKLFIVGTYLEGSPSHPRIKALAVRGNGVLKKIQKTKAKILSIRKEPTI